MAVTKILPTAHLITSANQYTKIPFQFTPENVRDACLDSIAVGMPEIELANSILGGYPSDDGSNNFMAFEDAIPEETRVTSFYMSGGDLRDKPGDYSHLMIEQIRFIRENFPDCTHFNMHPPVAKYGGPTDIGDTAKASVATWNHIAAVVSDPDIFLNVHNHLDFSCHNGYQVVQFFDEVVKEGSPQV
ncbi:MAG: hypothetical protein QF915_01805, partial [Candidatus Woesearchaeota archaeon]|nr:hypothetical protein [Candidatus Woesearchaeota archaeon]